MPCFHYDFELGRCTAALVSPAPSSYRRCLDDLAMPCRYCIHHYRREGPSRQLSRILLGHATQVCSGLCVLGDRPISTAPNGVFPFARPSHVSVYPTIFCENLRFEASHALIQLDRRYLALAVQRAPKDLEKMLRNELRLTVLPYRKDGLLRGKIRRLLEAPGGCMMRSEELARQLAVSSRTMHRRLSHEGTTFRELKEKIKAQCAQRALVRGNASIKKVAQAAGFRNAKSFSRAFRTWTGKTHRTYRDQQSKEDESPPPARSRELPTHGT